MKEEKTIKVVIYARISSKQQEDGFSISAQQELLRDYAYKNGMIIIKEFEDIETAKCAGRTNFNKMLKFLKGSKDCHTILVEKTDRLYRNLTDYVRKNKAIQKNVLTVYMFKKLNCKIELKKFTLINLMGIFLKSFGTKNIING